MNSSFQKGKGGAVDRWDPKTANWVRVSKPQRKARAKAPAPAPVQQRMYHAAKASRLMSGFNGGTTSADSELSASLTRMRNRSRQLIRDNPYARRAKSIFVNNVIGGGVNFDAKVMQGDKLNTRINNAVESAWEQWSYAKNCHTGGALCFSDLERMAIGEVFEAGEIIVRWHPFKMGDSSIPLALEVIEPERLADEFTRPQPVAEGNTVRLGVEVDQKFQRPVAYWIRKSHPGDLEYGSIAAGSPPSVFWERVPADQIFHLKLITRWPQTRGEPALCAVMRTLNDMGGYTEAEIVAARVSANVVFSMETDPNMGGDPDEVLGEEQSDGSDEFAVEPAMGLKLPPGKKLVMNNPLRPNTALDPFMRYMLREVSSGLDIPYDALSQDYSQTNYSSSRLAIIEAREAWKILQQWWVRSFREPLHQLWLRQAAVSRSIPAISLESYMFDPARFEAVTWQTRKWGWIDPTKDVEASKDAELAGYTTKTRILAENGIDFEDYVVERKAELEALNEAGIKTDTEAPQEPKQQALPLEDPPPKENEAEDTTTRRARVVSFRGQSMKRESKQTREMLIEFDASRATADGIPVTVTSDAVVEVMDGPEVLVHSQDAIDLSRAPLPIIVTHKSNQLNVGNVDQITIGAGRMRGMAKFGERAEAQEYERDVRNGTIRSVSAGYRRVKGYERGDGVLVTTRWMPTHVAMIGEPADANAGFFRSLDSVPELQLTDPPEEAVTEAKVRSLIEEAVAKVSPPAAAAANQGANMAEQQAAAGATTQVPQITVTENGAPGMTGEQYEKERGVAIRRLAQGMGITDGHRVSHWIASGKSYNVIADEAIAMQEARAKEAALATGGIGLTTKETNRFSITRAISALVTRDYNSAGFELEVSKAVAQRIGKVNTDQTFYVPVEVQQRTVMQVGTGSMGGYTVGTDIMSFVDIFRNRSVVIQSGARTLAGLVGVVAIPKKATVGAVGWIAEAGTGTASELTLAQITMTPKNLIGYQEYTKQLLLQGLPDVESMITMDLADGCAVELDRAALVGTSGSTNPVGVRFTTGIGTANPGTGTNVAYADLIKFQTTVAGNNALLPGFTYITTPAVAGVFMGKPRFTNSDTPCWDGGLLDGRVVGMPGKSTVQMLSGVMIAGDYSQVIIGQWQGVQIDVNPYAKFTSEIVGVKATVYADVAVRYPGAFAVGTGMTA